MTLDPSFDMCRYKGNGCLWKALLKYTRGHPLAWPGPLESVISSFSCTRLTDNYTAQACMYIAQWECCRTTSTALARK